MTTDFFIGAIALLTILALTWDNRHQPHLWNKDHE
jgi:hypothetical protein